MKITTRVTQQEKPVLPVDITPYLPLTEADQQQGRRVVLRWREASADQLKEQLPLAEALLKDKPTWTYGMAALAAALTACHVAPEAGELPTMDFYAKVIDGGDTPLSTFLEDELWRCFPQLKQSMFYLWPLLEAAQPIAPRNTVALPIEQAGRLTKRKGS